MDWLLVSVASLGAGFVDAIVGGGGLILVPALFAAYPGAHPATLLGSNKCASVWGTSWAAWQYSRQVQVGWQNLWPAVLASMAGSMAGAWLVTLVSTRYLRQALPLILLLVLLYTLLKKDLGRQHQPHFNGRAEAWRLATLGLLIGSYDGFFGPGTGSFFVFLLVRWLGYDFLHASASAKWLNVSTNIAAITLFAFKGHVWWHLALPMALANVLGSALGTRMALRHGAGFVRMVFLLVVGALIVKTSYDGWWPLLAGHASRTG